MGLSLPDITLNQVLLRVGAALLTLGAYGLAAAVASRAAGDRGPAYDGRLTPNPFTHLDVIGLVAAVFYRVTWMRPLGADPREFKRPLLGSALLVAAGTLAALALAFLALLARPLVLRMIGSNAGFTAAALLDNTFEVAAATALLNLVPLPPLLAGVLWGAAGGRARELAERPATRVIGTVLVAVLLVSGAAAPVFATWWRFLRGLAGF